MQLIANFERYEGSPETWARESTGRTTTLKAELDMLGLACMTIGGIGTACYMVAKAPKNPNEAQQKAALRWARRAPYLGVIFVLGFVVRMVAAFT